MKEPYGSIIDKYFPNFEKMGFTLRENHDYKIVLKYEGCNLEVSTEKFYEPSITTTLTDEKNIGYSVRVIRELFDTKNLKSDTAVLNKIKEKYRIDEGKKDTKYYQGLDHYIDASIKQLISFLENHDSGINIDEDSFQNQYREIENSIISNIGIKN